MNKVRLAIITTHPIQYYAPMFKLLAERCKLKVFYTWGEDSIKSKFDPGFGKAVKWDIPLLEGYDYEFLTNTSIHPGSHHFKGIINPQGIQRINAFQPNAILVYGWSNHSHLKILRYFKGKIPVWFRGDSTLIDKTLNWKTAFKNLFLRWIYSHVDKVFYVGSANKTYFQKYGVKSSQLVFAPHAIDIARFAEDRQVEASALRKQLDLGEADILILFAGKLELKKDPLLLLNAFTQLNLDYVHVLFVGDGALAEQLKSVSQGIKNKKLVHFLPFQNQQIMPVIYQSCDLFCLPSRGPGETWGLAVNEAMAAGKAILVSDKVGCAADLVKYGQNGYVFKSEDSQDLSTKLKLACINANHLAKLGLHSRKIINDWSFEIQVNAIVTELNEYSKH